MSAPCPFCGLSGGFHDDEHPGHRVVIPADWRAVGSESERKGDRLWDWTIYEDGQGRSHRVGQVSDAPPRPVRR